MKTKDAEPASPKSLSERLSNALLGVKGSSLTKNYDFDENPMSRLKLLLVRCFRNPSHAYAEDFAFDRLCY